MQVPHGWFLHFYIVSVASSIFWGVQLMSRSYTLTKICSTEMPEKHLPANRMLIAWAMLMLQGARRLFESLKLAKPSASKMWVGHWLLGMFFYIAVNIALWIETCEFRRPQAGTIATFKKPAPRDTIYLSAPSLRSLVAIPLFLLASGIQHDCHSYLASLPKYTLPNHPIFQNVVCPHYTAECVIYFALAIMAAPDGYWVNTTVFSALIFVVVNLGVTASKTKEWSSRRFGKETVGCRWKMVPWVF